MLPLKRFHIICCMCCLSVFVLPARAQNFDINLLKSINPQYPNSTFWKATSYSYQIVAGAVSMGSLGYSLIEGDRDLRYKSYELLIGIGISIIATDVSKAIVNRQRPAQRYPNDIHVLNVSNGYSFPSGHTSLAFATATSLTLTHRKWYVAVPAYLWAGCVGYSRMYLGRHYPSDVLGGAVVGAGSSLLSHWLNKKLFKQKQDSKTHTSALQ